MKVSLKVVASAGTKINILVNDEIKYIVELSLVLHKIISVKEVSGNKAFSIETDKMFSFLMKHHYTFLSENKRIAIIPDSLIDGFRKFTIDDNNVEMKIYEHLNKRYTHYPIYLNEVEIAEGLLINESKNFTIDFNVFLLDKYESHKEAICMFCAVLFSTYLISVLSPNKTFYGIESKENSHLFNSNWLKENFNIDL